MVKVKIKEIPAASAARKFRMTVEREKESIQDFRKYCVSFRDDLANKLDLLHKFIGLREGSGDNDYQIFFLGFYPEYEDEIRKTITEINKKGNFKIEFEEEELTEKQQKILSIIQDNPEGVSVAEIADVLGVKFVTIIKDAKTLLAADKIKKEKNRYFYFPV